MPEETGDAEPFDHRTYANKKRTERRLAAEAIGIDADYIDHFIEAFYGKIRDDALLGPIFAARVAEWPPHLERMKSFWRSVLHNSGEFSGNPMVKHLAIPGLELMHFTRWLDLFYETLKDTDRSTDAAQLVATRARMIADSMLTAIVVQREGISGGRAGDDLPRI